MEYLNESTNNVEKVKNKIQKDGIIEIGCVYCIAIYPRTKSMEDLQSINNKLICHICGMDTLIPIINDSVLEKECITFEEQIKKLEKWNKEAFGTIVKDDEDSDDYKDYGYNEGKILENNDYDEDDEDEKEIENIINRCLVCGIDMGSCNPRQLCGKIRCNEINIYS